MSGLRMALEIERKFLVTSDGWRARASPGESLRQAYLASTRRGSMRVRLSPERATLTVKSRRRGIVREEFTFEIPRSEAEQMLRGLCTAAVEKVRHTVRHAGMTWQVDVYGGAAGGLVLAEIELERTDQGFELPDWIGREVTFDPAYRNSAIARLGVPVRSASLTGRAAVPA